MAPRWLSNLVWLLLLHSTLWPPGANGSCCCCDCCCCDCCCCCCCCGCGSKCCGNNNANSLNSLSLGAAPDDGDLMVSDQTRPAKAKAGLGPGLLPDGSTGRNQKRTNVFGEEFNRRRRKRGFGHLPENQQIECHCNRRAKKFAVAMPYGSKPKQKPVLPSDWGMPLATDEEPSLGPGLLPDGSTGRRQRPTHGDNFFGDFFGDRHRRRRRRGQNVVCKTCDDPCAFACKEKWREVREAFQLSLVPLDGQIQQKNATFLRFLLGLVPEDQAGSSPLKDGSHRKRLKRRAGDGGGGGNEFTVLRKFFLVPVNKLAMARDNKIQPEDAVAATLLQTQLPKPPMQFYRPVEPSPESDQERYAPDYD